MEALVVCTVVSAGVLIADGVKYAQTHWVVCGAPDAEVVEDDARRRAEAQPAPWSWIPEGLIIPPPLPSPKKKQR